VIDIDGRKHIWNRRFLRPSLVPDQTDPTRPVDATVVSHDVAYKTQYNPEVSHASPAPENAIRSLRCGRVVKIWAAIAFEIWGA
jgi:hypothetical protein